MRNVAGWRERNRVAAEFVSECITPLSADFDTRAMASGRPGLPGGFRWRDREYRVAEILESWKESGPERGKLAGERYLRRHVWRVRMTDGSLWTVYFVRQPSPGAAQRRRWFLYEIERAGQGG